jgi:RHS repeat-associated protein
VEGLAGFGDLRGLCYAACGTENRLTSVTVNGQTTFVYDGDGRRVKKVQGGQTTAYAGSHYEYNVSTGATTSYYYAGSTRVAMRQGSAVYYLHGDHLGSATLTTDANGAPTSQLRYLPYGAPRPGYPSGSVPTDYRFTGQRSEEASLGSLYDYGARMYSPVLGRFLSADTIVPSPGNPQSLNRYSYVLNNPLKYTDPTGHRECEDERCTGPSKPPPYKYSWEALSAEINKYRRRCSNCQFWTQAAWPVAQQKAAELLADALFMPQYQRDRLSKLAEFLFPPLPEGVSIGIIYVGAREPLPAEIGIEAPNVAVLPKIQLPDDALVCRGGLCTADRFAGGTGVTLEPDGTLSEVSVNSAAGKSLEELTVAIPNRQVGVTTVGNIRAIGGNVEPFPLEENPYHATMYGITAEEAEELFTPTIPNPNRVP